MTSHNNSQNSVQSLPTISLQGLFDQDPAEASKLLDASKQYGFFYLNFQTASNSETILDLINQIYRFEERLFSLPQEYLMIYDVDDLGYMKLNGYKPKGRNVGQLKDGRDGFESYAIPKDGVLGLGDEPYVRPPIFDENMPMLKAYMREMQEVTISIHKALTRALGLEIGGKFEEYHRINQPSPCILRLLKYHPQPIDERGASGTAHTDLGSLTILFTSQPGLQVLMKGSDEWKDVEPRAGHAIVNIGDGMSLLTNGLLHSSLHRVSPPHGQAMKTRYSFAFLQRAQEQTPLVGLRSPLIQANDESFKVVTSGEWLHQKFSMLRAKTHEKEKNWMLTGYREIPTKTH
ncbi:hypothetical protein BTUL_0132g00240 [Botrytis tulipae]|uniref:Fe2OG dioxygenase domain-containing protein n=1 Tax=Botrytis tulipae TaxID=87230 RepID=A0A4Z1EML5_9HELO|nr:hypothetical protein BTUL_0132g00240 [Botrytis tulipae]